MHSPITHDNNALVKTPPRFSLAERFEFGRFNLREVASLANVSLGKNYGDVRDGKLITFMHGRQRFVSGPVARAYLRGEATA